MTRLVRWKPPHQWPHSAKSVITRQVAHRQVLGRQSAKRLRRDDRSNSTVCRDDHDARWSTQLSRSSQVSS